MGDLHIVEAGDAEQLMHAAREHASRLAVVGWNMPGMRRGERLAELALRHPHLPLVVVSALASPDAVRRVLAVPTVHALIPRQAPSGDIRLAVEAALQGVRLPFRQRLPVPPRPPITPRMKEVHRLLRQGMRNRSIAQSLGITEGTVKNYVSDLFRALQVSNRSQAALHDPESL
jgi:DNA-binding NarL/FixJ family response regulator